MNKKMNKKILFFFLFLLVSILPIVAFAQVIPIPDILENIKNMFIAVGAAIVVIGWIITGILYLTAGGGERLAVAKKALVASVIGTAVIVLATVAQGILGFYLNPPQ